MIITIKRYRYTRWGVDGELFIKGKHVADTTEHPIHHLLPGSYNLLQGHLFLKRGNGPMLNTDGSICVGKEFCPGCVLRTRETYLMLYNKIQKALNRGQQVLLIIE